MPFLLSSCSSDSFWLFGREFHISLAFPQKWDACIDRPIPGSRVTVDGLESQSRSVAYSLSRKRSLEAAASRPPLKDHPLSTLLGFNARCHRIEIEIDSRLIDRQDLFLLYHALIYHYSLVDALKIIKAAKDGQVRGWLDSHVNGATTDERPLGNCPTTRFCPCWTAGIVTRHSVMGRSDTTLQVH